MLDLTNIDEMSIEFKNDENSANKLIAFIIDFLLESNPTDGGSIDTAECKEPNHRTNCGKGYRDE